MKILEASWRLFQRHGFKKVSMADIAEAAGISKPTLYASFSNKEAVIDTWARMAWASKKDETFKEIASSKSLKKQLEIAFKIWITDPYISYQNVDNYEELSDTIHLYAPKAVNDFTLDFANCISEILDSHSFKKTKLTNKELSLIVSISAKGIKEFSKEPSELKKLVDGLISVITTFAEK